MEGYNYIDPFFRRRIKTIAWIVFSLILLADVAAIVCFVLFPEYWGVELLGFLLFTVLDVIYVLLNGLFYADKFAYRLGEEGIYIRRVVATEKTAVYRDNCIYDIRCFEKTWKGRKYYDVVFRTECGNFRLRYLTKEQFDGVFDRIEETYRDEISAE